ncbi:MAG: 2-oxo acid dehydrogenase subunit E2 [Phycisphaerales bacterium]|nr:2-oxo acid dehydrogenase subunit E2 [Phycisphaerales bacterium]
MYEFILPDLGEGVHEGEILRWHVEAGATINEDDPLVDIETDKAAITIPSPRAGTVVSRTGEVGDIVLVGNVIAVIDDGSCGELGATSGAEQKEASLVGTLAAEVPAHFSSTTTQIAAAASSVPTSNGGPVIAAPATRRMARELQIDIKQVPPTGPAGRVTPEDVQQFAAAPGSVPAVETDEPGPTAASPALGSAAGVIPFLDIEKLPDFSKFGPVETEPLRSIRRKVARKMVTSMVLVPHVAHMDEADVTLLDDLRRRQKERLAGQPGGKLTLLPFVIRAVTEGLKAFGMFNASLDPLNELITYKKYYNIGVAVDSGRGLIVPVIRDTDRKSVLQVSAEIESAAARARTNELAVDEMRGGSFTITNIGALGGTGMIPTINYPEVAILGMGRVQEKPVVVDGKIAVRKMLPLTLAFDHRIADGADAARFVTGIVRRMSNPDTLLIES